MEVLATDNILRFILLFRVEIETYITKRVEKNKTVLSLKCLDESTTSSTSYLQNKFIFLLGWQDLRLTYKFQTTILFLKFNRK